MRARTIATILLSMLICLQAGPTPACTSFCMQTPDGPVFGTNMDLFIPGDGLVLVNRRGIAKENFRENTAGKTAQWVSRYGSLTFSLVGREFAWGGMNEAGLVMTTMELMASKLPKPDERIPFDSGALVQYVLDSCGTVEEAIKMMALTRLVDDGNSPAHFLIADSDGDCAGFEYLDGEFVFYHGEDLPIRAMANMRYERALAAYERGGPRWWWSNPGHSAQRVSAAVDRMASYDASRDTCAITHAFTTLTQVVAAPHTKWNIVFDIAKRQIWYRSARSPAVKNLSLGAFDFSCEAPLLMLDVNAALDGNIEASFSPYDRDVNLELFQVFCGRWGIEVDQEKSAKLMDFFEGFECLH